jgi:mannose-6-phosphate isomerase-like protein (cupin superfamily)
MRTVLTLAALCGAASVTFAQAPAPAQPKTPRNESASYSDTQLRDIMQKSPAGFSTRLFQDSTHSTAFIRLAKPDTPHAHGTWSEVFVVKEGSGILETQGTITGITGHNSATHGDVFTNADGSKRPQAAAPQPTPAQAARQAASGDLAGTDIEGGKRQAVKAGDVILIPAGVPHRWVQIDQPVVYLDIKFPKSE